MKRGKWNIALLAVLAAGLVTAGTARAGSLTPSNAPAPTMHTLEEIYQRLAVLESNQAVIDGKLAAAGLQQTSGGMVLIPAGSFVMGACTNVGQELISDAVPQHTVTVSAFYMDKNEVTSNLWAQVHTWATNKGYSFGTGWSGKASTHPVHSVNWYDCVKWCNARSQKEDRTAVYSYMSSGRYFTYRTGERDAILVFDGDGYRLPTEAEWEKAARGGATGRRFPWSADNTIQHARANYRSSTNYIYDTSATRDFHPSYANAPMPYTSPVGSFAPNGCGLYDMAGNVDEWCWDWFDSNYYSTSPGTDPTGPAGPLANRVLRGGSWDYPALRERVADRFSRQPDDGSYVTGLRCARSVQ